jgi:hypothetical protein
MGLFSQFWFRLGDTPRSRHEAVDASRCGEAIQLQAIMLWLRGPRHCARSEAIHLAAEWIASSLRSSQ